MDEAGSGFVWLDHFIVHETTSAFDNSEWNIPNHVGVAFMFTALLMVHEIHDHFTVPYRSERVKGSLLLHSSINEATVRQSHV